MSRLVAVALLAAVALAQDERWVLVDNNELPTDQTYENTRYNVTLELEFPGGRSQNKTFWYGGALEYLSHLGMYEALCKEHAVAEATCAAALKNAAIEVSAAARGARLCAALPSLAAVPDCAALVAAFTVPAVHAYDHTNHKWPGHPTFDDFERATYGPLCAELTANAKALQAFVEGSLWADETQWTEGFKSKRQSYLQTLAFVDAAEAEPWTLVEVGFNAGTSSAMALTTFPNLSISAFDLCDHAYAEPNAALLARHFPGRVTLACGDSQDTLPAQARDSNVAAIFIDGGHLYEVAFHDLVNGREISRAGALVVVDDCDDADVGAAFALAERLGVLRGVRRGLGWTGLCVGRYL